MSFNICVIGLGYVGLPLAAEFGKKYPTFGFDIDTGRVDELNRGFDRTAELSKDELDAAKHLTLTTSIDDIRQSNIYIITVPTPIDSANRPDLRPLLSACRTVGQALNRGDIVIFESTVYPGATEEDCVPVLEEVSGLKFNTDFFCGYSPERINPGDKEHRLPSILKITSGSTPQVAETVNSLYASIITAGTHMAPSIRVAEAAKVIENAQRDINIAFVNELAMIFARMGLKTSDVLEAAGTKWNFLNFQPGLVGGHCIGVDPYYLTHKAESLGYLPQIITAGRRLNDGMGRYVATQLIKMMIKKGQRITESRILIMGFTFKENCPDIRNTRVIDIIHQLKDFGAKIEIFDPEADAAEVKSHYNLEIITDASQLRKTYDGIMLAVAHSKFNSVDLEALRHEDTVIYDVKNTAPNADCYL